MLTRLKTLQKWTARLNLQCNFRISTITAMAAGLGAACGYGLLPWWVSLAALPLLLTLNRRLLIAAVTAFAACLISGIVNHFIDIQQAAERPGGDMVVSGKLFCNDTRNSALPDLPDPTVQNCEATIGDSVFQSKVIFPGDRKISYGENLRFTGKYFQPQPAGLIWQNGEFSGEYPPLYGDTPLIVVDECSPAEKRFAFFTPFFHLRDILLKQLLSGIDNPDAAAMAAKLFFSASTGAPAEMRENFIESGTIHLFSVSGLHVAIVAGIILFLLRPLPFKWRYPTAALFVLLYVLCTGASLPAVRAGTMLITWCMMRSFLYDSPSWNSLMYTWTVFALICPETVGSVSALYSFGITAALLLLMQRNKEFFDKYRQIAAMMPTKSPERKRYIRKWRIIRQVSSFFLVPTAAFAAGSGISLYRQQIFVPGSIAANIFLCILTPVLFGAMVFKLTAGALLPLFDQCGAFLLEGSLMLLVNTTGEIADIIAPPGIVQPPWWNIGLFYIFFFGMLGFNSVSKRQICLFGTLIVFFVWQFPNTAPTPEILVINHGYNHPPLVAVSFPGSQSAFIIDVPDKATGALAGKILRSKGVRNAEVMFSSNTARSSAGIPALSNFLDITVRNPPGNSRSTEAFLRNIEYPGVKITDAPASFSAELISRDSIRMKNIFGCDIKTSAVNSGRSIEITTPQGEIIRETVPWCSLPTAWLYKVKPAD